MRLSEVPRVAAPSPDEFHERFVMTRQPVVLTEVLPASDWSPEFFGERFPDAQIDVESWKRVRDDDPARNDFYRTRVKVRMSMREFVDHVRRATPDDDSFFYLADYPVFLRHPSLRSYANQLKRFMRSRIPRLIQKPFEDPQLMYFGPPGAVSIMHFDTPDNLLAQAYGTKRVTLFSPAQDHNLYSPSDDFIGHFSPIDVERPDFKRFPRVADAEGYRTELRAGEVLFIPSRWWHHIRSLDATISVNAFWVSSAYFLASANLAYWRMRQIARQGLGSLHGK